MVSVGHATVFGWAVSFGSHKFQTFHVALFLYFPIGVPCLVRGQHRSRSPRSGVPWQMWISTIPEENHPAWLFHIANWKLWPIEIDRLFIDDL